MMKWGIGLVLAGVALGAVAAHGQALIEPDLASEMAGLGSGEKIAVTIALTSQADPRALEGLAAGKSRSERRALVVQALKMFSAKAQERVLSELRLGEVRSEVSDIQPFWLCNAVSCRATKKEVERIAQFPEVWFVEKSVLVSKDVFGVEERDGVEFTPLPVREWHISKIGADSVWNLLGITGQGVIVGDIDTGTNYNHIDLASHLWTDPNYPHHGWNFELNNDDPIDVQGHGSFMTGLIASDGTAGDTCGVAPRAQIMACRVRTVADSLAENQVFSAMQFCVAPPLSPTHGADLVLFPMGWNHSWNPRRSLWRQNVDNLSTAGLLLFARLGSNRGTPPPDAVLTPADCPGPWHHPADQQGGLSGVVPVAATDNTDALASFSSPGPVTWQGIPPYGDYPYNPGPGLIRPDLSAPGVNLASLDYSSNNGYSSGWSGTSLCAAVVAGVGALMLEKNPALLPWQVDSILQMTVRPLGAQPKNNDFGTGRVSAYQAVLNTRPFGPRHDVAIQSILAPGAKVDSLVPVAPVVRVQNYGTYRELNVPVHFSVDSSGSQIYHQIVTIPSLDSLAAVNTTFPNWTPGRGGITYNMTTWHTFSPDTDRTNDTLRSTTQTRAQDIRVISTNIGSRVRARSSVTPWLTLGAADYSVRGFNAICWIDSGATRIYNQSVPVDSVTANGTKSVSFPVWNTGPSGATYNLMFFHDFVDPIHNNDTLWVTTQASSQTKALIAFGDLPAYVWELRDTLLRHDSSSIFSTIDTINVSSNGGRNLSLSNLVAGGYGVVLTFSDYAYLNPTAMGDTLAAFMEQGGGVVVGVFADDPGWGMGGRYSTQYMPFPKLNVAPNAGTLGTVDQPTHPIMQGISAISVGNYRSATTTMQHGRRIAAWNTGSNLVGAFDTLGHRTAEVGFFPTAWKYTAWGGHNARMMVNAMCWAAGLCNASGVEVELPVGHLPRVFALAPARPNPLRGTTEIHYQLPSEALVKIHVFNVAGQMVRTLVNGKENAGYKSVAWDGRSESGARVASGVYFYRLEAGSFAATKKMVVIR